ncbi:KilA-N domain-containing protein [Colletotrichum gloeosporioides Cg-14]|uniref:KilA-N domain-containing protein n=1 Tax=Colletotrichum gloeosporioides (strain Cg-14) TaxID=1237896 RepID=T0K2J2_COLGC|nr:KilA-N domain-containing protein [Colletotrichum gloeosporioides Cg-14]
MEPDPILLLLANTFDRSWMCLLDDFNNANPNGPILITKYKLFGILNGISRYYFYPVCVWATPALCHTGAGVIGVISEDKNAEAEVETIIKAVEAEPAVVLDMKEEEPTGSGGQEVDTDCDCRFGAYF